MDFYVVKAKLNTGRATLRWRRPRHGSSSGHVGANRALPYHMKAEARLPANPGTVGFYCQSHRCSLCRRDSGQMVCAFGNEKWKYEFTPRRIEVA
jgi:hypothetical protein